MKLDQASKVRFVQATQEIAATRCLLALTGTILLALAQAVGVWRGSRSPS